jgi:transcriptional regulator with XRE-family HTH domain
LAVLKPSRDLREDAAVVHFSILRKSTKIEIVEWNGHPDASEPIDRRIAGRLAALRAERGWTLAALAERTGISRATLSRLERCELSPTATMLNMLCSQYGWTASRLMAEAESAPPTVVRAAEQVIWKDPGTGYVRRVLSPPRPNLKGELVEVWLPAGSSVSYDTSPLPRLEHHLWMLDGVLSLEIEGAGFRLEKGDCVCYVLSGPSRFVCGGKRPARYLVSIVHP